MKYMIEDEDVKEFFAWLKAESNQTEVTVPPPGPQLLELARQASQAHGRYFKDEEEFYQYERIMPLAASDGSHKEAPLSFEIFGGDWSLTREIIPQDPDWVILKIKCRQELIAENRGRKIHIQIGDQQFDFENVDRRGVAEIEVPSGLDFGQAITVKLGKLKNPE